MGRAGYAGIVEEAGCDHEQIGHCEKTDFRERHLPGKAHFSATWL